MINTSKLIEGDKVVVTFDDGKKRPCIFCNGQFIDDGDDPNRHDVYGSSVASYTPQR